MLRQRPPHGPRNIKEVTPRNIDCQFRSSLIQTLPVLPIPPVLTTKSVPLPHTTRFMNVDNIQKELFGESLVAFNIHRRLNACEALGVIPCDLAERAVLSISRCV